MNNHDLKKGISRGFDQLSGHIERKTINTEAVPALPERERRELFEVDRARLTLTYYRCRALCVLAIFLLLTGCFTYVYQVRGYTSIHIQVNPSLTIYLKGSKIVRIKADNKDAEPIIDGINHKESLDQAIDLILIRIKDRGYFDCANANLKIKIHGKDKDQFEKKVAIQVQKTMGERQITARVQINRENPENITSIKKERDLSDTGQIQSDETRVEESSGSNKEENTTQPDEKITEPSAVKNTEKSEEEDKTSSESNTSSESKTSSESNTFSESKTASTEMNDQNDSEQLSQSNKENPDQGTEKKISTETKKTRKTKQKRYIRKKSKELSSNKKETGKKESEKKRRISKKQEKKVTKKAKKKTKDKKDKNSKSFESTTYSNTEKDDGATGQTVKKVRTENSDSENNEYIEKESSLNEGTNEDQESSEQNDEGQ